MVILDDSEAMQRFAKYEAPLRLWPCKHTHKRCALHSAYKLWDHHYVTTADTAQESWGFGGLDSVGCWVWFFGSWATCIGSEPQIGQEGQNQLSFHMPLLEL